jgi:hypothetical protein
MNTQTKRINWLFPEKGITATASDFANFVRDAEESGFMSLEESNKQIAQWRQK